MAIYANARHLGAHAVEGLNHLGLADLEQRLAATIDLLDIEDAKPREALSALVEIEREANRAIQALGRAPRWCGVSAAIARYRTEVSDLVSDSITDAELNARARS